jgi:hypothetical protein
MRTGLRRTSGMRRSLILGAGLLVLATGCGAGGATVAGSNPALAQEAQLYEANATVLEQGPGMAGAVHGPELCLGGIDDSLPPQCGGVPIANWDWAAVDGEETRAGTTWGDYRVVGTYDGESFTTTQVGPAAYPSVPMGDSEFDSLCEPASGGWAVTAWSDNTAAAQAYMQAQPDYVRSWITYIQKPTDELDPGPYIFNVVFTGDAERHEAELRDLWSGPLCVVAQDVPSERELAEIRTQVEGELDGMGLTLLMSSQEEAIDIVVILDENGAAQAAFDERYGPGVVKVTSALQPVEQ